jgi:hypothetical protein
MHPVGKTCFVFFGRHVIALYNRDDPDDVGNFISGLLFEQFPYLSLYG